jgi:hypothetical protein
LLSSPQLPGGRLPFCSSSSQRIRPSSFPTLAERQ